MSLFLSIAVFAVIFGIIFAVKPMQYSAESNKLQKAMVGMTVAVAVAVEESQK